MHMAFVFKRLSNGANAPIHHVAGGHHVNTGIGLHHGLLDQLRQSQIVQDVAFVVKPAILSVAGERI